MFGQGSVLKTYIMGYQKSCIISLNKIDVDDGDK